MRSDELQNAEHESRSALFWPLCAILAALAIAAAPGPADPFEDRTLPARRSRSRASDGMRHGAPRPVPQQDVDERLRGRSPRELRALPGIGAKRALAISDERFRRGGDFPLASWSELDGIGAGTVGGVRDALTR